MRSHSTHTEPESPLPKGGGEAGARLRRLDWDTTPLGPPERWPQTLRTVVELVLASSQPMLVAWGPERVVFHNDACAALLGEGLAGALGEPFSRVGADLALGLGPSLDRTFAGDATESRELEGVDGKGGGPAARLGLSFTPLRDGGEVSGALCIVREPTTALSADPRAEGSGERRPPLVIAKEAAGLGIHDYDVASGTIHWDERVRELWGVGPDERVTYDDFLSGLHPDDRAATHAAVQRALDPAGDGTFSGEYRVISRADGRTRWVAATGHVTFEKGRAVRIVGSTQDITPRKEAERAQALLAAVVNSSQDAIVSKTLDGIVTSWNPGAERIFGYRADEMEGHSIERIIPAELHAEEQQILARLRRGKRVEPFDTVRVTKEGRRIDVSLTVSPVFDAAGRILGASKVARDVTERKRAERALRESEERLREADRQKDRFLAVLSHELRNPLAAICSATEFVRIAFADGARLERACGVLERQSAHMTRLVDGLLEISRISRGKIRLEKEILSLREVLRRVLEDHRDRVAARGLELDEHLPPEPLWTRGDEVRLTQVLGNLLDNAAKFTAPPGRVTIALEREGGEAVIRVRDSGVGIAPELLERIFEPFQQAGQGTARTSGGLGVGLPLARSIVEMHAGTLRALSEGPGTGAELRVRLPLAPAAPRKAGARRKATARPQRILVVEDNVDAAEALRDLLEIPGHDVRLATGAAEALQLLRDRGADVVLCDLGLPGTSGHDFARAIRSDDALRDLPLVAVTGYGQPEDRRRSREAGFDEHLTKPVDLGTLDELLARLGSRPR